MNPDFPMQALDQRPSRNVSPIASEPKPATPARAARGNTSPSLPTHLVEKYQFLVLLLWILASISVGRIALRSMVLLDPDAVVVGVDPNTAPWWDMTALPGVGKTTAQNIISYRNSVRRPEHDASLVQGSPPGSGVAEHAEHDAPVFRNPMDLTRVRGIGPRTVQYMAPHLRFDDAESHRALRRAEE